MTPFWIMSGGDRDPLVTSITLMGVDLHGLDLVTELLQCQRGPQRGHRKDRKTSTKAIVGCNKEEDEKNQNSWGCSQSRSSPSFRSEFSCKANKGQGKVVKGGPALSFISHSKVETPPPPPPPSKKKTS